MGTIDTISIWDKIYTAISRPLEAEIVGGLIVLLVGFIGAAIWRSSWAKVDPNRFRILFAEYGVPNLKEEVTKMVTSKVKNGHLNEIVNANLFNGRDPAPGKLKRLRVEYLFNQDLMSIEVEENQRVNIP